MKPDIEVTKQGSRVVIGKSATAKRLAELNSKKGTKTQAEISEEILLRLKRIEQHLGIK